MTALELGDLRKARRLIRLGAKIDHKDGDGMALLHYAVLHDSRDLVEFLLANGANVDVKEAWGGRTPLDFALDRNRIEMIKLLLAHGAEFEPEDTIGMTPLVLYPGFAEIIKKAEAKKVGR